MPKKVYLEHCTPDEQIKVNIRRPPNPSELTHLCSEASIWLKPIGLGYTVHLFLNISSYVSLYSTPMSILRMLNTEKPWYILTGNTLSISRGQKYARFHLK